jgi:hypothetical protein
LPWAHAQNSKNILLATAPLQGCAQKEDTAVKILVGNLWDRITGECEYSMRIFLDNDQDTCGGQYPEENRWCFNTEEYYTIALNYLEEKPGNTLIFKDEDDKGNTLYYSSNSLDIDDDDENICRGSDTGIPYSYDTGWNY